MTTNDNKTFLSTREVAELLGVNEKVVYSLIADKGLPATKITGKWLFPYHLVLDWLEGHVINRPESSCGSAAERVLILAGSNDLLLDRVIGRYNQLYGSENLAAFASVGSMGGIMALKQNLCHIGSAHLMHSDEQQYNFAYLQEQMGKPLPVAVKFCQRTQGLMVAPGNPKKIQGISSLAEPGITMVNRSPSTGTRVLLDHELKKAGIQGGDIDGYDRELPSHLSVGIAVLSGQADVALGIETAAVQLGLDFIPLRQERFDLLIHKNVFFAKSVQLFIGIINHNWFHEAAAELGGYQTEGSGQIVYPD